MIFSDLQPNDIWRLNGSARERDKIYTATISYRKINKKQMSSAIKTCHIFTVNKIWRYSAHKRQLNEYKTQFKRWINLAKCCYSWVLMLTWVGCSDRKTFDVFHLSVRQKRGWNILFNIINTHFNETNRPIVTSTRRENDLYASQLCSRRCVFLPFFLIQFFFCL